MPTSLYTTVKTVNPVTAALIAAYTGRVYYAPSPRKPSRLLSATKFISATSGSKIENSRGRRAARAARRSGTSYLNAGGSLPYVSG